MCCLELSELFNNLQTLRFRVKLAISIHAVFRCLHNSHLKAEELKMDQMPPITIQWLDLFNNVRWLWFTMVHMFENAVNLNQEVLDSETNKPW